MASIVTFKQNPQFLQQVVCNIYDNTTNEYGDWDLQTTLEIDFAEYIAVSITSGNVSVKQKSTNEYLFYEQPWEFYRDVSFFVGFPTYGSHSATITGLNNALGGNSSSSQPTPTPVFAFTQFVANGTTITPDNSSDILTLTPSSGISITGNANTDTITFENTGILGLSTTLPITRSLGSSPTIGIEDATTSSSGAMSASDKTKLDGITAGAAVASVTGTAPIVSSGGTTPSISITEATTSAAGAMSAADKTKLDGIAAGAEVNVNANWDAVIGDAVILNKPTIPSQYSIIATNATLSYTLILTDANKFHWCNSSSNYTITIPLATSVAFDLGTEIAFMQVGTGSVTIQGAAGVTVRTSQTAKTAKQYAVIAIKKVETDTWVCVGDRQAL
jgi:hypothetical protein